MKFQNPSMHRSKLNRRTHRQADRQTDRQAESNSPFHLFQSWGHKNKGHFTFFKDENWCSHSDVFFLVMRWLSTYLCWMFHHLLATFSIHRA